MVKKRALNSPVVERARKRELLHEAAALNDFPVT